MSIDVMSLVFKAKIESVQLEDKNVSAPVLKFILIALADHCNEEGDSAYPSLATLERKTAFTHQTVLNGLEALKKQGLIIRAGISRKGTTNYSINVPMLKSLVHQVGYLPEPSKPDSEASISDSAPSKPGSIASKPGIPEPSLTVLKPSINQEDTKKQKTSIPMDIWTTLMDVLSYNHDTPPANLRRIAEGVPVSFEGGVLTVQHPEAEWAQQRFGRTLTNMLQGLRPGASIAFERGE